MPVVHGFCLVSRISQELGCAPLYYSPCDTKVLQLQRFVRLSAFSASTLILALYLSELGFSDARIGLFLGLTLAGDIVTSLLLTLIADRLGRRWVLAFGGILMAGSGVVFGLCTNYWLLLLAAIVGVISPR